MDALQLHSMCCPLAMDTEVVFLTMNLLFTMTKYVSRADSHLLQHLIGGENTDFSLTIACVAI